MLTVADVVGRLLAAADPHPITRENYDYYVAQVLPQTVTYTDIYQLARNLTLAQKRELEALVEALPESQELARVATQTWLDLATGTVLLHQAWVAQLPVVRDYVAAVAQQEAASKTRYINSRGHVAHIYVSEDAQRYYSLCRPKQGIAKGPRWRIWVDYEPHALARVCRHCAQAAQRREVAHGR